jgi:hypothetical protein
VTAGLMISALAVILVMVGVVKNGVVTKKQVSAR